MKIEQIKVLVSGRVQGVGFRYYTKKTALSLQLTGWVRNLENGSVEALVEGPPEQTNQFLSWCNQGPASAKVTEVLIIERKEISERLFSSFEIV